MLKMASQDPNTLLSTSSSEIDPPSIDHRNRNAKDPTNPRTQVSMNRARIRRLAETTGAERAGDDMCTLLKDRCD
jgi:hypothetical protein